MKKVNPIVLKLLIQENTRVKKMQNKKFNVIKSIKRVKTTLKMEVHGW